jgi:hypothetical protein
MFRKVHYDVHVICEMNDLETPTKIPGRRLDVGMKQLREMYKGGGGWGGGNVQGFLPWHPYSKVCDYESEDRSLIPNDIRLDRLRGFHRFTRNFPPVQQS